MKSIDQFTIEEEELYQIQARYCRKIAGKCPALRYHNRDAYCSRLMPCEEFAMDSFISIRERGEKEHRLYSRCRYIERDSMVKDGKKGE